MAANDPKPTAEEVLRLIDQMAPEELERLAKALEYREDRPNLLVNHVVVSREKVEEFASALERFESKVFAEVAGHRKKAASAEREARLLGEATECLAAALHDTGKMARGAYRDLSRHREGPKVKHERVERRHRLIDMALRNDITEPRKVFDFVREHDSDSLLSGKRFVDPKGMMKRYYKDQKAKK